MTAFEAPLLRLEAVTKSFGGFKAVDEVSLDIPRNSFFALLGPSGCGKTTLLRMLGGFERASAGRILLDGEDMARVPPNRRPVNMVFQSYAVFPHMTVARNVAYGLEVAGTPREEIGPRVEEAIAMVRLDGMANRKPHQLSGGQRQRVALARALIKRPKLLLLDEPLSALDRKLREDMQLELVRLQHEVGITFIIVTHDQEEALSMASDIAVMHEGRILQVAAPRQLYEHPTHRFVAEFIGASNSFETRVLDNDPQARHAGVEAPLLGRLSVERAAPGITNGTIIIRPEKIRLDFSTPEPFEGEITLDATIRQIAYYGDLSFVYVTLADGRALQCSRYNTTRSEIPDPPAGSACKVGLHPDDMLLVAG